MCLRLSRSLVFCCLPSLLDRSAYTTMQLSRANLDDDGRSWCQGL